MLPHTETAALEFDLRKNNRVGVDTISYVLCFLMNP